MTPGVFHFKSLLSQEALEQIDKFCSSIPLSDEIIENPPYSVWYKRPIVEPNVLHLRAKPSDLNIVHDIIVKTASDLFHTPFNYDDTLNVIRYDVGGESPIHYDGSGRFTGKEYTFIAMVDDSFEGGEFFINDQVVQLDRGDALIFQINFLHGVKLITNGTRISLVARLKESNK